MNKKLVSLLSVATMSFMFVACSNDVPVLGEDKPAEENIPSEVPIRLSGGAMAMTTRGAILSEKDLPGDMGVWCLAKAPQNINQEAQPIKWYGTAAENATCCLMDNVQSSLSNNVVSWSGIYYYPVSQFYNYDFYATYPYTTNITTTTTRVTANYKIDGRTDLLWARATSDEAYAYSAKYFRLNGGVKIDNVPCLKLEHMLTRLTFTIDPGATIEGAETPDYSKAAGMKVKSLQILGVYTDLNLVVADYNNLGMNIGNRLTTRTTTTEDLSLCDESGMPFAPAQVPSEPDPAGIGTQIGESLMLFPQNRYQLRFELIDANGVVHVSETPLYISNTGFQRGTSYRIHVTVHGPQDIEASARIIPWDEVEGPSIEL